MKKKGGYHEKASLLAMFAGLSLMISPGQAHTFEANQPLIETKDYRQIRKEVQVTYQFKQQIKESTSHLSV